MLHSEHDTLSSVNAGPDPNSAYFMGTVAAQKHGGESGNDGRLRNLKYFKKPLDNKYALCV
jgi:hypothetical protein